MNDKLLAVLTSLKELEADTQIPKNVKIRISQTIKILEENSEQSIKVSRALCDLEELSEDVNIEAFTRTQIFNIVSMLETSNNQ